MECCCAAEALTWGVSPCPYVCLRALPRGQPDMGGPPEMFRREPLRAGLDTKLILGLIFGVEGTACGCKLP